MIVVEISSETDIIHALGSIRYLTKNILFNDAERQCLYVSVSELIRNTLNHAGGSGVFLCELINDGVKFKIIDTGPGIQQLNEVLNGTYRSPTGLGLGLVGAKRLLDELHIESNSEGTRIVGIKRASRKTWH